MGGTLAGAQGLEAGEQALNGFLVVQQRGGPGWRALNRGGEQRLHFGGFGLLEKAVGQRGLRIANGTMPGSQVLTPDQTARCRGRETSRSTRSFLEHGRQALP